MSERTGGVALRRFLTRQETKRWAALGAKAANELGFPREGDSMTTEERANWATQSKALALQLDALLPGADIAAEELEGMTRAEFEKIAPAEAFEQEPAATALLLADLLFQRRMTPEQQAMLAKDYGLQFDAERNAAAICELLAKLPLVA